MSNGNTAEIFCGETARRFAFNTGPGGAVVAAAIAAAESGRLPDWFVRWGIRRFAADRLRTESSRADQDPLRHLLAELRRSPIAMHVAAANEQHYELPPEFFATVLGRRLKYSGAFWPPGVSHLDDADDAMLELTCRRAGIEDGMSVLDLGCGWGSLSLWIAEHYPRCRLLAVSNSRSQAGFIRAAAERQCLGSLEVTTADINEFAPATRFDRVVSVEMFEHVRNYERLLGGIVNWLAPTGKLFVHIFSHRSYPYLFEPAGPSDWMARYFFTGGTMPSHALLAHFQRDLLLEEQWHLDGRHYARTAESWLANLDAHSDRIRTILAGIYGDVEATHWLNRWRIFFLTCAEVFGYREGREWGVSHYLFSPRR